MVGGSCLGDCVGLVERHHRGPGEAVARGRHVLVTMPRLPNWPDHDATLGNRTEAGAQALALAHGGDPGPAPVCELMIVKVRTVSGPQTPSAAVPQFD